MCPYLGTFPPALARSIVAMLSEPGDTVMDPFCGRGTTLLETRLLGRIPVASDLNPIAIALACAKNVAIERSEVEQRLTELEHGYDRLLYLPEAQVQGDSIQLIYHPGTLAQLCYLRRNLVHSRLESDQFLLGALLGVMHGSERQDGSSGYASISMPNTFSMAPNYVRRFVATNQLSREERNVFKILRGKLERLFRQDSPVGCQGTVVSSDAKKLAENAELQKYKGRVKLVLTSPPYLDVVNYAKLNWIRAWLLKDVTDSEVVSTLDDKLNLRDWLEFQERVVGALESYLAPDGTIVMVVGDVARAERTYISLARVFIQRMVHSGAFSYIGCFQDNVGVDTKTTRIWKETKGKATEVDRVIVLSKQQPTLHANRLLQALGLDSEDSITRHGLDADTLAKTAASFASAASSMK